MSLDELRHHRAALERWRDAYTRFLEDGDASSRAALDGYTPDADLALEAAGCYVGAAGPGEDERGRGLSGVVIWIHDRGRPTSHSEAIFEAIELAIESLDELEKNG